MSRIIAYHLTNPLSTKHGPAFFMIKMEEKKENGFERINMTAETMKQDIEYLFAYFGMPNQAEKANGSSVPLAQAGYALGMISEAKGHLSDGNIDGARQILNPLYHFPDLIRKRLNPEDKTILYTAVGEPVTPKCLLEHSIARLNDEFGVLERGMQDYHRKINKMTGSYVPGRGEIAPVDAPNII